MVYLLKKNIKTKQLSDKLDYTKLEPFKIIEKLGLVIFKLELLLHIKIYLVFHILLLKKVLENTRQGPVHIDEEI